MTPRQISIVRDSFAHVRSIPDRAGARFYTRLFSMAPEARAMFPPDMAEQNRKLVVTLASVVDALDDLETILPAIRDLARAHVGYGVEDHHYGPVGLALIETLREVLGPAFDGELEQAWRDAYRLVAETMIAAAREG